VQDIEQLETLTAGRPGRGRQDPDVPSTRESGLPIAKSKPTLASSLKPFAPLKRGIHHGKQN